MTTLISATENLSKNEALALSRFIGVSSINLLNAGILANSNEACVAESRRIYKTGKYWQSVKRNAKRVLSIAEKHGITTEKPYKVIDGVLWGICGNDLVPCR